MDGSSSFIVVGCGQVGYRVACLLLALGEDVHVVSSAVRKDWRRRLEEAGAGFTVGDGTDQVVLRSVGVQNAQAVLACTSSDTTNVRVTLEAKRIAPGVKVVARLFDQHLAERLENGIGIERALAMSVVAAPSFASAATGTDVVGEFHIGEMRFMLVRTLVHGESDLVGMSPTEVGAKFRAETVLRIDKDGKPMSDIRHNEPLEVGEVVKLIGVPNDLASLVPDMAHRTKSPRKRKVPFKRIWSTVPASLKYLTAGVFTLTVVSVAVFNLWMGLRPIDSLYFVVTTLTTTGYGDISAKDSSDWLKIYTCVLMVLGSAAVAVLYSIITDLIVTARFRELAGERPVPDGGHVIVVGLGNLGYRVIEELRDSGLEVVAVDINPDNPYAATIRSRVPFVLGDARDPETLVRANLARARSIVVTTQDDAVNLSVGLLAKLSAHNVRTVVRIFDGGFAAAIQEVMDIDVALSASRLAAPEFVAAAIFPDTVAAFVLRGHLVALSLSGTEGRCLKIGGQEIFVHGQNLVKPLVFDEA